MRCDGSLASIGRRERESRAGESLHWTKKVPNARGGLDLGLGLGGVRWSSVAVGGRCASFLHPSNVLLQENEIQ